jgi:hypothetical protein
MFTVPLRSNGRGAGHRKHRFQQFLYFCVLIRCRGNQFVCDRYLVTSPNAAVIKRTTYSSIADISMSPSDYSVQKRGGREDAGLITQLHRVLAQAVTLPTSNQAVPGSNLGPDTGYPDLDFSLFSTSALSKCAVCTLN